MYVHVYLSTCVSLTSTTEVEVHIFVFIVMGSTQNSQQENLHVPCHKVSIYHIHWGEEWYNIMHIILINLVCGKFCSFLYAPENCHCILSRSITSDEVNFDRLQQYPLTQPLHNYIHTQSYVHSVNCHVARSTFGKGMLMALMALAPLIGLSCLIVQQNHNLCPWAAGVYTLLGCLYIIEICIMNCSLWQWILYM